MASAFEAEEETANHHSTGHAIAQVLGVGTGQGNRSNRGINSPQLAGYLRGDNSWKHQRPKPLYRRVRF